MGATSAVFSKLQMYSPGQTGCGLSEPISYKNISGIDDVTEIIVSVIDGILDHFNIESASFVPSSFGDI
jgi:hypothetical protein